MRHLLFGIPVDDLDEQALRGKIDAWLKQETSNMIVTTNPEFILLARREGAFHNLLASADLSVADGVGLRFAISALTEGKLQHRHTGVDLIRLLCEKTAEFGGSVLLIGGYPGTAEQAAVLLNNTIAHLNISAIDPGHLYGNSTEVTIPVDLLEHIRVLNPTVLIAALGQGKQERFIRTVLDEIPLIKIGIGVGGAFDTIAGIRPRAPFVLRRMGLEWFWRLLIEPKRFGRIFRATVVFPIVIIFATLKQHIFLKALLKTLPEIWKQLAKKS